MSFDSPDTESRPEPFPRLYHVIHTLTVGNDEGTLQGSQEENQVRKRDTSRRKEGTKRDRKDKGYVMFEQEDSDDELVKGSDTKSPRKVKKHPKPPSFKLTKKEKPSKTKEKEKEKEKDKDEKKEKKEKDKAEKEKEKLEKDKEKKEKVEKEQKKVEEDIKPKWRKKILLPPAKPKEQDSTASVTEDVDGIFGVSLVVAVERSPCHDGIQLPVVVRQCIDYIEEFGLLCEGIYRMSGVKSKVQLLKDAYNKGDEVYLQEHEPNVVASLLKLFLRQLPEPLLTAKLMPKFEQASTNKNIKQKVENFQLLLGELPPCNRLLLSWVIVHMTHVIAKEKENKMSLQNVSIVLSPTLQISHRVLNVLFTYSKLLFKDTVIKRYVPPLKPVTSRWTLELPDSPLAIEEELKKQESLLSHLHEELMKVKDLEKEEQLWEVQRVVTQLKRRLKHAKQMQESLAMSEQKQAEIAKDKLLRSHQLKEDPVTASAARADDTKSQDLATVRSEEDRQDDSLSKEASEKKEMPALSKEISEKKEMPALAKEISEKKEMPALSKETSEKKEMPALSKETSEKKEETPASIAQCDASETEQPVEKGIKQDQKENEPVMEAKVEVENVALKVEETRLDEKTLSNSEKQVAETEKGQSTEVKIVASDKEELSNKAEDAKESVACSLAKDTEERSHDDLPKRKWEEEMERAEDGAGDVQFSDARLIEETRNKAVDAGQLPEDGTREPVIVEAMESLKHDKRHSTETDESSDAYTDVLVEEEEEEKEDEKHEPRKYVQLQEESPMELVSRSLHLDTEEDLGGKRQSTVNAEQGSAQFAEDDQDVFSDTTTSSEPSEFEDNEEYQELEQEHTYLVLEEEELLAIGNELRQKIAAERNEIERLQQDIAELKQMRQDMFETSGSSSSLSLSSSFSDSDDDLDDDDLREMLKQLLKENEELELDNAGLCDKIHQERQICIAVKVQNRMIQQRHLESSGYGFELLADQESLL